MLSLDKGSIEIETFLLGLNEAVRISVQLFSKFGAEIISISVSLQTILFSFVFRFGRPGAAAAAILCSQWSSRLSVPFVPLLSFRSLDVWGFLGLGFHTVMFPWGSVSLDRDQSHEEDLISSLGD